MGFREEEAGRLWPRQHMASGRKRAGSFYLPPYSLILACLPVRSVCLHVRNFGVIFLRNTVDKEASFKIGIGERLENI